MNGVNVHNAAIIAALEGQIRADWRAMQRCRRDHDCKRAPGGSYHRIRNRLWAALALRRAYRQGER